MIKYKSRFVILLVLGLVICLFVSLFRSQRQYLKIAAGKPNGDSFIFAKKLAEVVNNSENNITISVLESTPGSHKNLELLRQGEVQLAMAQADIPAPPQAQLVSLLFPDMYQLIVKKDSGIENILDLRGKRVALPPEGGGQIKSFDFLMKHYSLIHQQESKYKFITINDDKPAQAFCAGKADVVFYVRRAGNDSIRQLLKECNGKLIPIKQAGAMKIEHPDLETATIPQGAYQGNPPIPGQNIITVSVNRLLLAHKDVDKDVIRRITRILYEHRQDLIYDCRDASFEGSQDVKCYSGNYLKKRIPAAALIRQPNKSGGTGKPIHRGARSYYNREDPSWFERYSGVMEVFLAITLPFVSWCLFLFRENIAKKNKADDYILEVTALMDAKECVQAVNSFIKAHQSNQTDLSKELRSSIIQKAAKILLNVKLAEHARERKKISNESLKSFKRTLGRTAGVIERIDESEEIFNAIVQEAAQRRERELSKRLINQLQSFIIHCCKYLGIKLKSLNSSQAPSQLEKDLRSILNQAKAQNKTQLKNLETPEHLKLESQNIRQDLEAILKRSVNALVEERISTDSFQSFRVVWQIAVGEVNK